MTQQPYITPKRALHHPQKIPTSLLKEPYITPKRALVTHLQRSARYAGQGAKRALHDPKEPCDNPKKRPTSPLKETYSRSCRAPPSMLVQVPKEPYTTQKSPMITPKRDLLTFLLRSARYAGPSVRRSPVRRATSGSGWGIGGSAG